MSEHAQKICETPPPNALACALRSFAILHLMNKNAEAVSPYADKPSEVWHINLLASMRNTSFAAGMPPMPEKGLAGVSTLVEGMHKRLRLRHTRGLYDAYREQVLEQAAAHSITKPTEDLARFETVLAQLRDQLKDDALVPSLVEYHAYVKECLREDRPYTLRDELEIMLRGATFFKELNVAREELVAMRKEHEEEHPNVKLLRNFDGANRGVYNNIVRNVSKDIVVLSPLKLTLRDPLGNVITTVELPTKENTRLAAGIILGASSYAGFADSKKFPSAYGEFVRNTIGEAQSVIENLIPLADQVRSALTKQNYSTEQADVILCNTHFNLSPQIWHEMREIVTNHLETMAFHSYVASCATTPDPKDAMFTLSELEPLAKIFDLEMPDPETLVPTTRMQYYTLIRAIESQLGYGMHSISNNQILKPLVGEIKALKDVAYLLKENLLGAPKDSDEITVFISKKSDAQQEPTIVQREQLKEYLAEVEAIYAKRPSENTLPALESLITIMKQGLEQSGAAQGLARLA